MRTISGLTFNPIALAIDLVHDELVLEAPDTEVERAAEVVRETMENVYPLEAPLKVDIKIGQSWEH